MRTPKSLAHGSLGLWAKADCGSRSPESLSASPLGGVLAVLLIAYLWAPTFEQPGSSGLFLAGIFAVLLYVGVLVHELAHAWAARSFGYPVQGITLWLLGGYTVYERRDSKPGPEFVISVGGTAVDAGHRCRLLGPGRGDQWIRICPAQCLGFHEPSARRAQSSARRAAGRWRNREVSRLAGHRISENSAHALRDTPV